MNCWSSNAWFFWLISCDNLFSNYAILAFLSQISLSFINPYSYNFCFISMKLFFFCWRFAYRDDIAAFNLPTYSLYDYISSSFSCLIFLFSLVNFSISSRFSDSILLYSVTFISSSPRRIEMFLSISLLVARPSSIYCLYSTSYWCWLDILSWRWWLLFVALYSYWLSSFMLFLLSYNYDLD